MEKLITKSGGAIVLGIAVLTSSLAFAQTSNLSVSCSGNVSTNVITWSATATGGNSPYTYVWSGTNVSGTSSSAMATYSATGTYEAAVQVTDASSTVATSTCSASVTSLPPTPTSTIIHRQPTFMPPILQINPSGRFLGRGMMVQSIGSDSFTAKVWGITFTVKVNNETEFLLKGGNRGGNRGDIVFGLGQLQAGDELGVSGWVDANQSMIVNADVVRNYSVVVQRAKMMKEEMGGEDKRSKIAEGLRNQIEQILKRIEELQKRINERLGQ